jgi:hypothetical protein
MFFREQEDEAARDEEVLRVLETELNAALDVSYLARWFLSFAKEQARDRADVMLTELGYETRTAAPCESENVQGPRERLRLNLIRTRGTSVVGSTAGLSDPTMWLLSAERVIIPAKRQISQSRVLMHSVATECEGRYDGWEIEIPA